MVQIHGLLDEDYGVLGSFPRGFDNQMDGQTYIYPFWACANSAILACTRERRLVRRVGNGPPFRFEIKLFH